jgi:hypothetical protein
MESALHARDEVGVHDAVLLDAYQDEDAFVENLEKRFGNSIIYVSTSISNSRTLNTKQRIPCNNNKKYSV